MGSTIDQIILKASNMITGCYIKPENFGKNLSFFHRLFCPFWLINFFEIDVFLRTFWPFLRGLT